VCACDVRTYRSKFERTRAVQWVCEGAAVELTRARSNAAPSARSNVQEYVRTPSEKYFFNFFFKNIYKNKITKN
jgi:hypothetical protein